LAEEIIERWLSGKWQANINGLALSLRPIPTLPEIPLSSKRGQAEAFYLIQSSSQSKWILKKFYPARIPDAGYLTTIRNLVPRIPGTEAATTRFILASSSLQGLSGGDSTAQSSLAGWLDSTVLMPEVIGVSWEVVADDMRDGLISPTATDRLEFAQALCQLIAGLEDADCSHRDLSSGNVFLNLNTKKIDLIDWDSMFHPTLNMPKNTTAGTAGYIAPFIPRSGPDWSPHASWQHHSDRFSMALLVAELLVLTQGSPISADGGLFRQDELTARSGSGITAVRRFLESNYPKVGELFVRALHATSFASCPAPKAWIEAITKDARRFKSGMNKPLRRLPLLPRLLPVARGLAKGAAGIGLVYAFLFFVISAWHSLNNATGISVDTTPRSAFVVGSVAICRGDIDRVAGVCREDPLSQKLAVICQYQRAVVGQTIIRAVWYLNDSLIRESPPIVLSHESGDCYDETINGVSAGNYRVVVVSNDIVLGTARFVITAPSIEPALDANGSTLLSTPAAGLIMLGKVQLCTAVSGWDSCVAKDSFVPGERVYAYVEAMDVNRNGSIDMWFQVVLQGPDGVFIHSTPTHEVLNTTSTALATWGSVELPQNAPPGRYLSQIEIFDSFSHYANRHTIEFKVLPSPLPVESQAKDPQSVSNLIKAKTDGQVTAQETPGKPNIVIIDATHKHTFGGCSGQLEIGDNISFRSYLKSGHSFTYSRSEIKAIDGDGVVDIHSKKWHFRSSSMSPNGIHKVLADWFAQHPQ